MEINKALPEHHKPCSLYIHFPFCRKKCRYCDFYSVSYNPDLVDDYITALQSEWLRTCTNFDLKNTPIKTIYMGGGTPSLLSPEHWNRFSQEFLAHLLIDDQIEWTLECNPDSFTREQAKIWLALGINRLTIGIQTMHDRELRCLGRCHHKQQTLALLNQSLLSEFHAIGIDIMYGLPGQTLASLTSTLEHVLSNEHIKHLSAYELTLAEKTPFAKHQKILPLPPEDTILEMTELISCKASEYGFTQYEIANFAKPGYQCKHNLNYWNHSLYIGLGPAAHSYVHPQRYANIADLTTYINCLADGKSPIAFRENLDQYTLARELIFLGLRTSKGLNEDQYFSLKGLQFNSGKRKKVLGDLLDLHYLEYVKPQWRLTPKGLLIADTIMCKLL